jgi:NosR/NirI family transcriptional regulator, nitrous oxide reductase regulator
MKKMIRSAAQALLDSPNMAWRRPALDDRLESNLPGLYVVGDLAGAPVVKLAMQQGYEVAHRLIAELKNSTHFDTSCDVAVIGAGAAGLNAALTLQAAGVRVVVFEKSSGIAATFEDFPEGKWIYAEPQSTPKMGPLWLEEATKEEFLTRWRGQVAEAGLPIRTNEAITGLKPTPNGFVLSTAQGQQVTARRVVLAAGQRGNPRWLGVPGEERPTVMHRLYSPRKYHDEQIIVIGGGNSAVEAALALCGNNNVTLVHRGPDFSRAFAANRRQLDAAVQAGRIRLLPNAQVASFREGICVVNGQDLPCDHAFVLVGAELPADFLKTLGIRLENEWTGQWWLSLLLVLATLCSLAWYGGKEPLGLAAAGLALTGLAADAWRGSRFSWLGIAFLISYTVYGAKFGPEFWPYRGWGYQALSFFGRPWSFWYTVLYTGIMTVFGLRAMKRWGFDKQDQFQVWRYACLIGFQWIFFFLIPEFLFQWAVKYQWVGERLAADPNFASNAWRSYGLVYAWPLFFYTFFAGAHQVWIVWGALLSFVLIPLLVLFHGKRYCSWICGCGGLAETLGDRWRHLAPKGKTSIAWERMNGWVFGFAVAVTLAVLGADLWKALARPAAEGIAWYRVVVDCWLVGIIPVTLYPFFGGKVWCRYWCPLAKMMQIWSELFTRFQASRFAIVANDKCIACGECTRNCQVGIDVMNFAMKQEELNNVNSSCIGCGICVTVCPMDVLSFAPKAGTQLIPVASIKKAA